MHAVGQCKPETCAVGNSRVRMPSWGLSRVLLEPARAAQRSACGTQCWRLDLCPACGVRTLCWVLHVFLHKAQSSGVMHDVFEWRKARFRMSSTRPAWFGAGAGFARHVCKATCTEDGQQARQPPLLLLRPRSSFPVCPVAAGGWAYSEWRVLCLSLLGRPTRVEMEAWKPGYSSTRLAAAGLSVESAFSPLLNRACYR